MRYTILIFFVIYSFKLFSCDCFPRTLEEDIQLNTYIFSAKVINQKGYLNTVIVTNVWKGELTDTIVLKLGTTSCHKMNLEMSKEYIIFMDGLSKGIANCSRTTELKFSQDIDKLNERFKGISLEEIDLLTENEINFINNVMKESELSPVADVNNDSIYFIFKNVKDRSYEIMTIRAFVKFDHLGEVPLLVELKTTDENYKLYAFEYWNVDLIKPKKCLRAFRKK